jgi:hypothetical protein
MTVVIDTKGTVVRIGTALVCGRVTVDVTENPLDVELAPSDETSLARDGTSRDENLLEFVH